MTITINNQQLEVSGQLEADLLKEIEKQRKPSGQDRFLQLWDGLTIKIDKEKSPDSIFYFNNGQFMFELDAKNDVLWCDFPKVWSIFYTEYDMDYNAAQALIRGMVEKHFKWKGVTPGIVPTS